MILKECIIDIFNADDTFFNRRSDLFAGFDNLKPRTVIKKNIEDVLIVVFSLPYSFFDNI